MSKKEPKATKFEIENENIAPVTEGTDVPVTEGADPVATQVTDDATAQKEAEKLAKFKAMKKAAAERFKNKRAAEKADRLEKAKAMITRAKETGLWDQFIDDEKKLLNDLANPVVGGFNESTFNKLFGAKPEVGASVTLRDAFEKTLKGKAAIDKLVKEWAEKGIIVTYKAGVDSPLDSTYTIEALPSA